jgi:hypothetical protein
MGSLDACHSASLAILTMVVETANSATLTIIAKVASRGAQKFKITQTAALPES